MIKWIKILLTGVLVSFFYFPFEFKFLPGINTKMMLAAVGLVVLLYSWVRKREFAIPRELFFLLILSGVVSLVSLFSITYNQTPDTAYVSYIVSAAVWLSAAFTTCYIIYTVHGRLDITLLINYLTGVCVFQCIIAIAIDFNPSVMAFVDRFYVGGEYMRNLKRLYGIGAGLDVAGTRFSCVLICLSYLIAYRSDPLKNVQMYLYFLSFAIITVLGNMMARTTVVGAVMGLLFMVFFGIIYSPSRERNGRARLTGIIVTVLAAAIPMTVYYYRTNPEFYELTRFAFEGFFSLAEKGEWEVASNEMLKNMIVYPDEFHRRRDGRRILHGHGYRLPSVHLLLRDHRTHRHFRRHDLCGRALHEIPQGLLADVLHDPRRRIHHVDQVGYGYLCLLHLLHLRLLRPAGRRGPR